MTVNYANTSPYKKTQQNSLFLEYLNLIKIPPDDSDIKITISKKYHHKPWLLAKDLYNNVEYDWVFLVRNRDVIEDMIFDFVENVVIYVPTPDRLLKLIG